MRATATECEGACFHRSAAGTEGTPGTLCSRLGPGRRAALARYLWFSTMRRRRRRRFEGDGRVAIGSHGRTQLVRERTDEARADLDARADALDKPFGRIADCPHITVSGRVISI